MSDTMFLPQRANEEEEVVETVFQRLTELIAHCVCTI